MTEPAVREDVILKEIRTSKLPTVTNGSRGPGPSSVAQRLLIILTADAEDV